MIEIGFAFFLDQDVVICVDEHFNIVPNRLPIGLEAVVLQHCYQVICTDAMIVVCILI